LRQSSDAFESDIRHLHTAQAQAAKSSQARQMFQSGVGQRGTIQYEQVELWQALQVMQDRVRELAVSASQFLDLAEEVVA
jgi:hypothetical protein